MTMRNRLSTSSTRRVPGLSLLAALVAVVGACGGGGTAGGSPTTPTTPTTPSSPSAPSAPVATTAVVLSGSAFAPPDIQVVPGAVVTFTNNDQIAHNVVFSNTSIPGVGDWTSGARTVTMPAATGTYPYRCSIHAGMTGTVTVK